ncbi:MAG: hypothetical protein ACLQUY_07455 [Ktedonobacterales bacterium]
MPPTSFTSFFVATSSGGAALIGLLFVATSISPERIFSRTTNPELAAVAASAFTALVNAFFISTAALLPRSNIGYTAAVFALVGSINSVSLGVRLAQNRYQNRSHFEKGQLWIRIGRDLLLVIGSLLVYLFQLITAIQLIKNRGDLEAIYALSTTILVVDGIGLLRAWELLGARRSGLLGWLNPLEHVDPPASGS